MVNKIDALVDEYQVWLKANNLDLGSADEHLYDEALTDEQREWLADFCERWDEASDEENNLDDCPHGFITATCTQCRAPEVR